MFKKFTNECHNWWSLHTLCLQEKFMQGLGCIKDVWQQQSNIIKGRELYQSVILGLPNLFRESVHNQLVSSPISQCPDLIEMAKNQVVCVQWLGWLNMGWALTYIHVYDYLVQQRLRYCNQVHCTTCVVQYGSMNFYIFLILSYIGVVKLHDVQRNVFT